MTDPRESQPKTQRGLPNKLKQALWAAFALCAVFLFVELFLPSFEGPNRPPAKEATTVAKLRNINIFQRRYAAAHPKEGFACQLSLLKSSEKTSSSGYDPEEYLVSGTQHGYKYVVSNCRPDANGVATHYGVVALPLEPRLRTFCTDESGLVRSDESSSPADCLSSGRALQ
jgi:hypothetical protein